MAEISTQIKQKPTKLVLIFRAQEFAGAKVVPIAFCRLPRASLESCIEKLAERDIIVGRRKWKAIRGLLAGRVQQMRHGLLQYNVRGEALTAEGP